MRLSIPPASAAADPMESEALFARLMSRKAAAMLARNTVVSCFAFALGLVVLWALVHFETWGKVEAGAASFVVANSLHYILGRSWIFQGTDRGVAEGYLHFLANAGAGLLVTIALYAAFLHFTAINYIVARVIVSLFAGLAVFVLNAVFNFRQL